VAKWGPISGPLILSRLVSRDVHQTKVVEIRSFNYWREEYYKTENGAKIGIYGVGGGLKRVVRQAREESQSALRSMPVTTRAFFFFC